jgi:hypothetical protein
MEFPSDHNERELTDKQKLKLEAIASQVAEQAKQKNQFEALGIRAVIGCLINRLPERDVQKYIYELCKENGIETQSYRLANYRGDSGPEREGGLRVRVTERHGEAVLKPLVEGESEGVTRWGFPNVDTFYPPLPRKD